ncbi:hypothetical protein A3862_15460 [Methylobacterium sp. XJLW]|uniref:hypothetical protein n=1 Tax=Methylobacterium sp. XJLW TaxID=739141 RepID=UPI000DAAF585|nr:hypothetical protein [Methylobacterium sp. XJLW]AWV16723.1 hypothetical protein A3862_15460 [Methylobacterium sp. XJLW]
MTRAFDDYDFDARQRAAEAVEEYALYAATTFACQACGEEHDIADRVVLRSHPEMPAVCWLCASSEFPSRRS